ncbi:hypothetical protein GCM10023335_90350 [Streptomyces siamensis]|uniref:Uncharacterized protein n=1 Tax=Streptomyces siamensis TaxID=1274986 RepID=A0ABP9JS12_9ACTN
MKSAGRTWGCQKQSTMTGRVGGRPVGLAEGDGSDVAADAVARAATNDAAAQSVAAVLAVCLRIRTLPAVRPRPPGRCPVPRSPAPSTSVRATVRGRTPGSPAALVRRRSSLCRRYDHVL